MACVALKPGKTLSEEDLIAHCRRSLANYKIPRRVEFSETELPKNASGKLAELRIARGDGSYQKKLSGIQKLDLLILDDFGLKPLQQTERHDLLEIIEDRHGVHSTLITSQLPVSSFYEYLNEPTIADALLDRLLNGAHRLELKGDSLRRKAKVEKA